MAASLPARLRCRKHTRPKEWARLTGIDAAATTPPMNSSLARRTLLLVLAATLLAATPAAAQLARFPTAPLTIVTASGPHRFTVEVATTPAQMEQGLMFRQSLAPDAGMIFDYGGVSMASMWMKNTLIPLDMLFVDAKGRVIGIHERAVPQSLDTIPSPGPARAVIELNGGTAARLGIRPGDKVVFPTIFGNAG
ncbi:MAG TPA: DUF192 domain-containing protein [Stellaceae bacterium]|nr:DUF192 domain-containing protein [Stellaceae bacterium]